MIFLPIPSRCRCFSYICNVCISTSNFSRQSHCPKRTFIRPKNFCAVVLFPVNLCLGICAMLNACVIARHNISYVGHSYIFWNIQSKFHETCTYDAYIHILQDCFPENGTVVFRWQWSHAGRVGTLHWRHNGRNRVSNHQPRDCLLNPLFRRRLKKTSKLRVTGLCVGNSPGTCANGQ